MSKRKRSTKPPAPKKRQKGTKKPHHNGRQVTVYDAVANRASYEGFIKSTLRKNAFGERHRRSQRAYPADEVLGRRKHAPEEPIPFGEEEEGLPDSDLLIAIHQYASDFYAANGMGPVSYRTLDETALLAVGILLEETARTCLGGEGDLVFIEPKEEESEEDIIKKPQKMSKGKSRHTKREVEKGYEGYGDDGDDDE